MNKCYIAAEAGGSIQSVHRYDFNYWYAISPKQSPAFTKAFGRAKIPGLMFPLSKWIIVSQLVVAWLWSIMLPSEEE